MPLVAGSGLQFDLLPGSGPDLVVSFASIGSDRSRPPAYEFWNAAQAGGTRSVLFVTDARRQWGNTPDFAPLLQRALHLAQSRQNFQRILYLGQSMGGFVALAGAQIAPPTAILAISPQFSICPTVMPKESRWADWTAQIPAHRFPSVPLPEGPRRVILHGLCDDRDQAQAFPRMANCDHYLFPRLGHSDLARHLKTQSLLPALIDATLDGDRRRMGRLIATAGGERRKTDQLPR